MPWTLAQLQAETLAQADLSLEQAGGQDSVRRVLSAVHAAEWKGLLNALRYLRMSKRTLTLDSESRVAVADLSSGAADAQERFYRVLAVSLGDGLLVEVSFDESPLAAEGNLATMATGGGWRREGDYLRVVPSRAGQTVAVWVNHTPTPAGALAGDSSTVTWPEDYELVLAYEAAARLLARGGAEAPAADVLRTLAQELRLDMLADLGRTGTGRPLEFRPSDDAGDWGAM